MMHQQGIGCVDSVCGQRLSLERGSGIRRVADGKTIAGSVDLAETANELCETLSRHYGGARGRWDV